MKKTEEITDYPRLTPAEFELILEKYGMTKSEYCDLRRKGRSWLYVVFRAKQFVPIIDMETLANEIGHNVFAQLAKEVQQCRKCKLIINNE